MGGIHGPETQTEPRQPGLRTLADGVTASPPFEGRGGEDADDPHFERNRVNTKRAYLPNTIQPPTKALSARTPFR
jgi:hypothetical protein